MDYCLRNKPVRLVTSVWAERDVRMRWLILILRSSLFESPECGNMFVEAGEECDCGLPEHCENPCCNPYTCKLHVNATCATGDCCDTTVLLLFFFCCRIVSCVKLAWYSIYSDLFAEERRLSVPFGSARVRPSWILYGKKRILPWGSLQVGRNILRSRQSNVSFFCNFYFFRPTISLRDFACHPYRRTVSKDLVGVIRTNVGYSGDPPAKVLTQSVTTRTHTATRRATAATSSSMTRSRNVATSTFNSPLRAAWTTSVQTFVDMFFFLPDNLGTFTAVCCTAPTWTKGWNSEWSRLPSCLIRFSTLTGKSFRAGRPMSIWVCKTLTPVWYPMVPNVEIIRFLFFFLRDFVAWKILINRFSFFVGRCASIKSAFPFRRSSRPAVRTNAVLTANAITWASATAKSGSIRPSANISGREAVKMAGLLQIPTVIWLFILEAG